MTYFKVNNMKKIPILLLSLSFLVACGDSESRLKERAAKLCEYIPDHELRDGSEQYLTADFHAVLDTMFNLPAHEAMDHEWLYYFVTGNGGTIADYTVDGVEKTDATHAVATITVRQKWDDGSFDESSDVEIHHLAMEKVDGRWLMSDFDGHKTDCIRHIELSRKEDALRDAVCRYLVDSVGGEYLHAELCIPTLMIVAEDDGKVYGDFWVWWYIACGDTLVTVSGGTHSGCMTIAEYDGKMYVAGFEQTVDGADNNASARRIFGPHYEVYLNMHGNSNVREAVRREQLAEYVKRKNAPYRYYRDHGRPAEQLVL